MINVITKQPGEQYPVEVDFSASGKLPSGTTISSGTVKAEDSGSDVSGTVLGSTSATISGGNKARVVVKAGTDGKEYKITFTVTLSDGSKLEEEIFMRVKET